MPRPGATGVMTVPSPGEHHSQYTEFNQSPHKHLNNHSVYTPSTGGGGVSEYQGFAAESNRYSHTNGSLSQGSGTQVFSTTRMSSTENANSQILDSEFSRKSIPRHVPGSYGDDTLSIGTYGNGSLFGPVVNGENAGPMSSSQPPSLVNSNNHPGTSSTAPGASGFLTTPSITQGQSVKYPSPHTVPSQTPSISSSPPIQPSTLRQRHTLQVPVTTKNRTSTGSITDTAVSSGRFSPTTTTAPRRASMSLGRRGTRSMDNYIDEIPQDEDAAKAAEAIIAKRESKRRRKEEEEDDKVIVGTKVDINHANWVTAYNMLTGIRFVVCDITFNLYTSGTHQIRNSGIENKCKDV